MTAATFDAPHIAPELIEAEDARRIARDELIATLRKLQERNRQRFMQAGGCTRCNSSGRLSASFSEDGHSVTEDAGPCPGWTIGEDGDHATTAKRWRAKAKRMHAALVKGGHLE